MSLHFHVGETSAVPVYEQLRSQIAGAITTGTLPDGSRLPATRALADELGVAVNTVIHAYRELSAAGLIASRRRYGTVVTADRTAPADVTAAATRLALRAEAAGLDPERVVDIVRSTVSAARQG